MACDFCGEECLCGEFDSDEPIVVSCNLENPEECEACQ
jgi:hypothetical protein